MLTSFFYGVTLPVRALRLILRTPRLLLWSIIPMLTTFALYLWGISHAIGWSQATVLRVFASRGWSVSGWGAWLTTSLLEAALIVAGLVTFSFVTNLVAIPINDFLAEATEPYTDPRLEPVPSPSFRWRLRLLSIDLTKTVLAALTSLVALLVSWIPVVNLVAFCTALLLVTFQFVSYPQTRRGEDSWAGLRFLTRNLPLCLGFGLALFALLAIPFLSFLFLPIGVVGGTLLYARARVS